MTPGEACARLAELTTLSASEWEDFLSLPPDAQKVAIANYASQDWATPTSTTFADVMSVLETIAALRGA